jgi:tetratricopeptide (TPR) repeat protein
VAEARRDFTGAIALLEKILGRDRAGEVDGSGNDRVFLVHLAMAYQALARHRESADAFGRAAAIGEADPALLGQQVNALLLAKDNDAALATVRAARGRHPEDRDLLALEANVLRARGDVASGRALIEKLRQQAPRDAAVLAQVADFHRRALDYASAEATLRDARAIDPRNLRVLFQLGAVLERQKRHDDAEAAFREALAVEPRSAPILNYLGYMNADRNVRVEEAAQLIERALAIDPDNGAYMDSLGWALFRLDRVAEAETYLRRAVTREPNAVVFDHLGDVLRKRGLEAEAVENWRRALAAVDEDEELDRARVERKIHEALAVHGQAAPGIQP